MSDPKVTFKPRKRPWLCLVDHADAPSYVVALAAAQNQRGA